MAWNSEPEGHYEYMTLGPYRFPHERDLDCNALCRDGGKGWHMHSSDFCRKTGGYIAVMCRWVQRMEKV